MRKRIINFSFGLGVTAAFFLVLEAVLWGFGVRLPLFIVERFNSRITTF